MKRFFLTIILLSAGLQLQAQTFFADWFRGPTRKELSAENDRLKADMDSLQFLVDSLESSYSTLEADFLAIIEGNSPEAVEDSLPEYTPEVTDSLLHLWYKNSFSGDFDAMNEYDMDSVKFVSDIPDSEIEKRLTDMNSFISLPYNDVVKNYIILYSEKMRTQMGRVLGMSQYYFPIFEEAFVRYGLPVELKYMAIVESMLNPVARSRAGACGMWQFIYSTARSYGLEINSYVDERYDFEKSVDAAARYLRDAYKIFGDWSLAISAYNCGAGNVSKAIRRAGGSRDFWSIYPFLPRETRGYVPAFVGAMYAMTYSQDYGIVPQEVGMPAKVDTFEIRRNLHFDQISAVVGVPKEDIRNLNPQYLHDIIPGSSHPYILKLPYTWTGAFVEVDRDSLYAFKADSLMSGRIQKEVADAVKNNGRVAYRVRSGDYLGKIAIRYGVTVSQIKSWNNLRSSNIRVGQILYIYARKTPAPEPASSSSKSSGATASGNTTYTTYTVKSGDALYNIAKLYPGVSAEDIKAANGMKSNRIMPGQVLKIPSK